VVATLSYAWTTGHGHQAWHWNIRYERYAHEGGVNLYRKLAVEEANRAWPIVRARSEAARNAAMARGRFDWMLSRVEERAVVTIEEFAVEQQSRQMLLYMISESRRRWEWRYRAGIECRAIEAVMNAASAELFRRRQEGISD
jgi:hypothetical protein